MRRLEWIIVFFLVGITLAIYWPVRHFDLVYFDDPMMMTDCPEVQAGLTWASVKWAFTGVVMANWNPLTSLSFLAVAEFFGVAPGPHHLVNAVIHALNAGLLFLLLWRLTGATWRSAVAAAIFAWHPQRVESVAWIIERKDVLCGFFFLLALWLYAQFVTQIKAGGQNPSAVIRRRKWFYFGSLLAFALALLSKPMAVTLPFVLLLLDYWPLRRIPDARFLISDWKKLIFEKWPFFILMLGGCLATYCLQHDNAAMVPWTQLGLAARVPNVVAGYAAYLAQLFWPVDFAAIYPYPKSFDGIGTALKAALLLAVSAGCLAQLRRRPWLAVGWCWYLGMAVPVIGLVQVGGQAMADRYTYLPLIGPVVALVWTAAEIFSRARGGKIFLTATTVLILSVLAGLSARQLQFWRNTVTLFEHTLAVTTDNSSGQFCLAVGLEHQGRLDEAMAHYRIQIRMSPQDYRPHYDLARVLEKVGRWEEAVAEYQAAAALGANADDYIAHLNFANALSQMGQTEAAVFQLNEALRIKPDATEALNNLAWTLATTTNVTVRNGSQAVALAQKACALASYKKTIFLGTLAAAYAATGEYDHAITTGQRACDLALKNGETDLFRRNQQLLDRYRAHKTASDE